MAQSALEAVEQAVEQGQGSGPSRAHLGASIMDPDCPRKLWYIYRWASKTWHSARLLRLFARGSREEWTFNDLLAKADITVWDVDPDTGQQWRIEDHGGHFGGSLDGVVRGLPEAPEVPHLSEQKTHNDKSFKNLVKKGVAASKPVHFNQMQLYMHYMHLPAALYQAVNKNDDTLHYEIIQYDQAHTEPLVKLALDVITSDVPLPRMSEDPSHYKCKWCDHSDQCHGTGAPQVSCRTCVFATPEMDGDGRWSCGIWKKDLSFEDQKQACPKHLFIPPMLAPWAETLDGDDDFVSYTNKINGQPFVNGQGGYTSAEIASAGELQFIGDPAIDDLKENMGGRVVG